MRAVTSTGYTRIADKPVSDRVRTDMEGEPGKAHSIERKARGPTGPRGRAYNPLLPG